MMFFFPYNKAGRRPLHTFTLLLSVCFLAVVFVTGCQKVGVWANQPVPLKTGTVSAASADSLMGYTLGPGVWGYTDKSSYNPGDSVVVFLSSDTALPRKLTHVYTIDGRVVYTKRANITVQNIASSRPWAEGFGLSPTYRFVIPGWFKSGVYLVEGKIPFIVKSARKNSAITVVYPSNTNNAYSFNGGKSLYKPLGFKADTVSFLRPLPMDTNEDFFSPFLKWINGLNAYDVQYIADVDLDDYTEIKNSKVLITIGHSEYWTRAARTSFDSFVASGHNALLLSGNNMFWQARYTPDKTKLICHRVTAKHTDFDAANPDSMTYYWNYPPFKYTPQNSTAANYLWGAGVYLTASKGYFVNRPQSPLLEGTGLGFGDRIGIKSYEYDGMKIRHNPITNEVELDSSFITSGNKFSYQVIAYDSISRPSKLDGYFRNGTLLVYKPSPTSGTVFNTCSPSWCSPKGMGGLDGDKIKRITQNAIEKSIRGLSLF